MKAYVIFFFLLVFNLTLFSQRTFSKLVNLPNQEKYSDWSKGYRISYLNGSLYSINWSAANFKNTIATQTFHFIKYNLKGDTIFTKEVYSDSFIYMEYGMNIDLQLNNDSNGFNFTFSSQSAVYHANKINCFSYYLDTNGQIVKNNKYTLSVDNRVFRTTCQSIIVQDTIYGIVKQYGRTSDSLSSYLVRFNGNGSVDTLIKNEKKFNHYLLSDFKKIDGNKYVLIVTIKNPSSGIYGTGTTFINFYDNNFQLISQKNLHGYWNDWELKLAKDTIQLFCSKFYAIQFFNNILQYSILKLSINGDSFSRWDSKVYKYDTASEFNFILRVRNSAFIGSENFLYQLDGNSLKVLRNMMHINPFNYCVINDSTFGFVGYNKKVSSVGLISSKGMITSLKESNHINNSISVFPNPGSSGILNIDIKNKPSFDLIIYNTLGEKVLEQFNLNSSEIFTDLNSGLYFLKVISGNQTYNLKWINY